MPTRFDKTDLDSQAAAAAAAAAAEVGVDPTKNVIALILAATGRLDDLRHADTRRLDELREAETRRTNEQMALRAEYASQLDLAESKRIDAIRAVDVNAVSVANERATAQASVLANQVAASAETLRSLVATTAIATEQKQTQLMTQFTDRLSLLEKAQYESKGLSGIPPQLLERMAQLEKVASTREGGSRGMRDVWIAVAAVVAGLAGLAAIAGVAVMMFGSVGK